MVGDADYARALLAGVKRNPEQQTEARRMARPGKVNWEQWVGLAERERGMKWEETLTRHRDWTRDAVLWAAVRWGGYRLSEVQRQVPGLRYQAAVQRLNRIAERLGRDTACAMFINRLKACMSTL